MTLTANSGCAAEQLDRGRELLGAVARADERQLLTGHDDHRQREAVAGLPDDHDLPARAHDLVGSAEHRAPPVASKTTSAPAVAGARARPSSAGATGVPRPSRRPAAPRLAGSTTITRFGADARAAPARSTPRSPRRRAPPRRSPGSIADRATAWQATASGSTSAHAPGSSVAGTGWSLPTRVMKRPAREPAAAPR